MMACVSFAATAQAQQKVFLNKGTENVETVQLAKGDYIAFGRPADAREMGKAEIFDAAATKNQISFSIFTKEDGQAYWQMVISKPFLRLYLLQYENKDIDSVTPEELKTTFATLMYSQYGYGALGTADFSVINGTRQQGRSETDFVFGGVDYYIATCDVVEKNGEYSLGTDMSYMTVKTEEPGVSDVSLDVEYKGLNADGQTLFSVVPGVGMKTLHIVLATTKSVDEFVNVYDYNTLMSTQAVNFTADQWNELKDEDKVWNIVKEDDYSFLVLGIDENGDQVRKQLDNIHIKPVASDNCPNLDVENFKCVDGNVSATFVTSSKTSSPITKATVLLIDETTWDNLLNDEVRENGYEAPSEAWPTVAAGNGAVDVTAEVASTGKYDYSKLISETDRNWYVLVFAVTDKNGTTISRTSFHSHLDNATSETLTHTYSSMDSKSNNQNLKAGIKKLSVSQSRVKKLSLK